MANPPRMGHKRWPRQTARLLKDPKLKENPSNSHFRFPSTLDEMLTVLT